MSTDNEFLNNIKIFWITKNDIERYVDYDSEQLRLLDPLLWTAWQNYKLAIETLNFLTN